MDTQSRQEFVRAAITFLQNPKLAGSSLQEKLNFLKDKGLTQTEVDEALNLALINRHQSQSGSWNFLLLLALFIGGFKLYQNYMDAKRDQIQKQQQFESGEKHKNQPTLFEIQEKISELKLLIQSQRNNFSTELQSLKTMLLSHEKFAAPPKIPDWQLEE